MPARNCHMYACLLCTVCSVHGVCVCVCVYEVAHSLSGMLVESLDGDGLATDNRLSCLNALKMTVYLLCQMCEQCELSVAKPVTVAVATKVRYKKD